MVGMSGNSAERLALPTRSALSLPERMWPPVCTSELTSTWLWPPTTSIIAGPPPLNGTCTMSTPATSLKRSEASGWEAPARAGRVGERGAGPQLEGLGAGGLEAARAGGSVVELAGLLLGERDQLRKRV